MAMSRFPCFTNTCRERDCSSSGWGRGDITDAERAAALALALTLALAGRGEERWRGAERSEGDTKLEDNGEWSVRDHSSWERRASIVLTKLRLHTICVKKGLLSFVRLCSFIYFPCKILSQAVSERQLRKRYEVNSSGTSIAALQLGGRLPKLRIEYVSSSVDIFFVTPNLHSFSLISLPPPSYPPIPLTPGSTTTVLPYI